jgi:hypothetical protein
MHSAQQRPWRLLGAQPSGPLAVALDRPTTDQSHLNRYPQTSSLPPTSGNEADANARA